MGVRIGNGYLHRIIRTGQDLQRTALLLQELGRMGANIQVEGKTAIIDGVQTLRGCEVRACDLRAGAAMVIAAMCAEGMTLIEDAHFIERGYEDIVGKLTALGAHIRRIETYETPSVSEDAG